MNLRWIARLAWRDSRGSRRRLLLATGVVAVSTAAIIAISGFNANVRQTVRQQAKALLGADLVLRGHEPFAPSVEALLSSLGGEQSRQITSAAMAYFPQSDATRLVQIRATDGGFPYYGSFDTEPATAARSFHEGPYAVVEDSLLLQFDAKLGDVITIGALPFQIVGRLQKVPGEAAAMTAFGPRVYIPLRYLAHTALVQGGSLMTYKVALKFAPTVDVERLVETLQPQLNHHRLRADTAQEHAAGMGSVLENLTRFLNLLGFIALVLGGVGVASAGHVYLQQKLATIAVLRCVGARASQVFAVYLTQAAFIGVSGGIGGVALGTSVQAALPWVLQDLLPVSIAFTLSWSAILQGMAVGIWVVLLFTLLPLLSVRTVSPLRALRTGYEQSPSAYRDPLRWLVSGLIVASIVAFALAYSERWIYGLSFCVALGVVSGVLVVGARGVLLLVNLLARGTWPYVWRQGLANLSRPHNQTRVVILALGLSVFLLMTVYLTQRLLLEQVGLADETARPNLVLFDIQSDQQMAVADLLRSFTLPVVQQAPIVTMRLTSVNGRQVENLLDDANYESARWALQREYHATYRAHLIDTETIMAGVWHGEMASSSGPTPISLEREIAETLGVTLGDEIVFDIQGVPVVTTIASIRRVEWQRVQPNFFVVFPPGVLEAAPQTFVLMTRAASNQMSALVQRAVVQQFPNVSALDVTLIMHTIDVVLRKIAFAIRFMAVFTVIAGLAVFVSAILSSRYQRVRESVLLRTLGASRAQIRQILAIEYLFLGSIAAVIGVVLAVVSSWLLASFLFEAVFVPPGLPLVVALVLMVSFTVLVGMLSDRGIARHRPLEILRSEGG